MATRADIRTDLTLELGDGPVQPHVFVRAVRAFFELIDELSVRAAGTGEPPTWTVRVKEGSNLVEAVPAGLPTAVVQRVHEHLRAGFVALETGNDATQLFSEMALKSAATLSRLHEELAERGVSLRLWVRKEPVALTGHSAATVGEMLDSTTTEHGSIDGRIEVISERGGTHVTIRETLGGTSVRCSVDEALLADALRLFGRRVEAYGEIRSRPDGAPVAIKVEQFVAFPSEAEVPSFEEVRGILKADA
jgi:hypothetical protein